MPTEDSTDLNPMQTVKEGLFMLLTLARLVEKVVRGVRGDLDSLRARQDYVTTMIHNHQAVHQGQYRQEYEHLRDRVDAIGVRLEELEAKGE